MKDVVKQRVLPIVILLGFFVTVFYVTMNVILVSNNTNIMKSNEKQLCRVDSIDEDDTIYLESETFNKGGTKYFYDDYIKDSDDVKAYVKVRLGSGTWYDLNNDYLFVEMTVKDIVKLYGVFLMYTIALLMLSLKMSEGVFRKVFVGLFVFGLLFSVLVFCLFVV